MHLGLIDWPFVPHNLLSDQDSPVPLPKFQMALKFRIFMSSGSKKRTQICYPILSKVPVSESPPQQGPYGKRCPLTGHFYVSLDIYLFIFPSESPVREPLPCSLTGSPWTGILRHQSRWSIHSFIHSFIHSCISPGVPKKEKHKVTVHGAPRRRKAYIEWGAAWFPKGIVNDIAISTPVPCSPRHDSFHVGLGRPEPR